MWVFASFDWRQGNRIPLAAETTKSYCAGAMHWESWGGSPGHITLYESRPLPLIQTSVTGIELTVGQGEYLRHLEAKRTGAGKLVDHRRCRSGWSPQSWEFGHVT